MNAIYYNYFSWFSLYIMFVVGCLHEELTLYRRDESSLYTQPFAFFTLFQTLNLVPKALFLTGDSYFTINC